MTQVVLLPTLTVLWKLVPPISIHPSLESVSEMVSLPSVVSSLVCTRPTKNISKANTTSRPSVTSRTSLLTPSMSPFLSTITSLATVLLLTKYFHSLIMTDFRLVFTLKLFWQTLQLMRSSIPRISDKPVMSILDLD